MLLFFTTDSRVKSFLLVFSNIYSKQYTTYVIRRAEN